MTDRARIEALWLEPGTAADAAAAANMYRSNGRKITTLGVLKIWDEAKVAGRLPPFWRPWSGFNENQLTILRRFMMIGMRRAA